MANVSRVFLCAAVFGLALLHLLEPSYDPRTRTLSEYVLSPSGWVFTLSILLMALGSAFVLRAVWNEWRHRRWLLLVWVSGLVVVALVPTDPGGTVTSASGALHAVAAALAIFSLLIAEVLAAFARRPSQIFAGVCALLVVVGLALSPVFGFGTGERIAIGAHVAWLLSIRVAHRSATSSTA